MLVRRDMIGYVYPTADLPTGTDAIAAWATLAVAVQPRDELVEGHHVVGEQSIARVGDLGDEVVGVDARRELTELGRRIGVLVPLTMRNPNSARSCGRANTGPRMASAGSAMTAAARNQRSGTRATLRRATTRATTSAATSDRPRAIAR
jgi:hypothetical protein